MNQFIQDVIHLTKWEFAIKYWYINLTLIVIALIVTYFTYKKDVKAMNDRYDKLERKIRGDK